jgi:hypothetical protein
MGMMFPCVSPAEKKQFLDTGRLHDPCSHLLVRQRQHVLRSFLEGLLLIRLDVALATLREAVQEDCSLAATKQDDSPVTAGLSFFRPDNPLRGGRFT